VCLGGVSENRKKKNSMEERGILSRERLQENREKKEKTIDVSLVRVVLWGE